MGYMSMPHGKKIYATEPARNRGQVSQKPIRHTEEQIEFIKAKILVGLTNGEIQRMFFRAFSRDVNKSTISRYRKGTDAFD